MRLSPRPLLPALAILMSFTCLVRPAVAQSDSELRQENQQLRDEVARLQQELDAAQARIEALEREVEQLRAGIGAGGGATPPVEERISIDESVPDASPRALLAAIKADYEEAVADMEMGDSAGSRERVAYLQAVERWSSAAEREFRTSVEWLVRVLRVEVASRTELRLTLQAIDPQYGTALGAPFIAALPRSRAQDLEEHGLDATYSVRGTAIPTVEINSELMTAEPFQEDAFVGPFATATIALDLTTMLQKDVEEITESEEPVDR